MRLSPEALGRMRRAIGDDDEVLADVLQSFVDEADALIEALRTAARTGQAPAMRQAAHTLKASARDLGDAELADLCAELEQEARTGSVERAEERAARIATACSALSQEVADHVWALQAPKAT